MSDSQQPQTPLARLEQLERQIASKVEEVVQGLRQEIGDGVRNAGEEIQLLLDAVREEKAETAPEPTPAPSGPDFGDLVAAVARIDGQSGQADVIKTLLEESAPYASRAVFFLVRQQQIRAWSSRGFGSGSGRVEGLQATTDQAPWNSVSGDFSSILDAEQSAALAQALGISAAADAAWIPFVLRGQLAGAFYVDRLEGDGTLDVAAIQLLTHCAATSLETAVSNPNVSATLELRGKLPEVIAEEHTIAVDEDEAAPEVEEEPADEAPAAEVPAEEAEEPAEDETEEPTEETTDETTEETTEETTDETTEETTEETTAETTGEVEAAEEAEEPTDVPDEDSEAAAPEASVPDVTAPAVELPRMKVPEVAAPEVAVPEVSAPAVQKPAAEDSALEDVAVEEADEVTEPPDFEMVEDTVPESEPELDVEPSAGDGLPAEALAEPPEVPDVELGEPEPAPDFEVAEAPEVPEVELGEPDEEAPSVRAEAPEVPDLEVADEVGAEEIELEADDEAPLDDDADLWEADDDEATAPGEAEEDDGDASVVTQPAVPVATPEPAAPEPAAPEAPESVAPQGLAGNETVRIDTSNLPQTATPEPATPEPATPEPATPEPAAPEPAAPEPAAPQPDAVQYPSSFAEPPAPVQAPPPSFAEPEAPEEPDEPSSSEVAPPPDMADTQPSSQVTPPADATPTSEVAPPPEPPGSSTEVKPPTDLEGPGLAFAAPTPAQAEREMDDAEEALHEEARRLARLLVSEIKLYNEEIIEEGRRTGNIYDRLKDDIDRSRQMYEERIDPRLADQEDYFHQELVQRLAGGDESLLGV